MTNILIDPLPKSLAVSRSFQQTVCALVEEYMKEIQSSGWLIYPSYLLRTTVYQLLTEHL